MSDATLPPPQACKQWCEAQIFGVTVLDDGAEVDLDWWNKRLERIDLPVRLRGRDPEGRLVRSGRAVVQRRDLRPDSECIARAAAEEGLFYLCAAWLQGNLSRSVPKRFPDVTDYSVKDRDKRWGLAFEGLAHLSRSGRLEPHSAAYRTGGGWPRIPGAGVPVLAAYAWAVGARAGEGAAQIIHQDGVSTLIHEGWLENPSVSSFTARRYIRYNDMIHHWAREIGTQPELVEMWLVQRWRERCGRTIGAHPC